MKGIRLAVMGAMTFFIFSCGEKQEQKIEINKVESHHHEASTGNLKVKVDNTLDPICEMKTAEHLSDTVHYNGKVFGFCSKGCKETFAENPEKYVSNTGK